MNRNKLLLTSLLLVMLPFSSLCFADIDHSNGGGKPPQYFVDESKLPFDALPGATAYWGVHTRAGYRIEVPDNWNGDLVMWAHGFRGTGLELTVDNHPLRPLLIALGYAWASSSYSRNDYDITSGVQTTHALVGLFDDMVGEPDLVYLTGASMGGHITAVSIEQYGDTYDAAMPICGVLGDYALFDYFLDFSAAAQQIGVGASQYPVDTIPYLFGTVPAIKANLEAFPGGWPLFLTADGSDLKALTALRSGGFRPNFDEAWFFWNTFPDFVSGPGNFLFDLGIGDGTRPRSPGVGVDNVDTVYQFDADPGLNAAEIALNENIVRVAMDPQGRHPNGLAQVPVISGDIDIPVLTLHNLGDLFVPVNNEVEYASRVSAHGKSDLLVQRAIRGVNHCGFTSNELATAFLDLVGWRELGVKPGGDDFSDPDNVADPAFGCTYTDFAGQPAHILATPCP
jgi:hypothetical protein